VFGDEEGCYFHKNGDVRTDFGIYITDTHIWEYEGGCTYLDVREVTDRFTVSSLKKAWSTKLICSDHDETYSYEAIIRLDEVSGTEAVTIQYDDQHKNVLSPCK
jgi:hypothetical protein